MKNKFLTGLGVILFSSQLIAQKTNETSAAIEYNKYSDNMTMMMTGSGDAELGKKAIEKAKGYIDLAAANETTKESAKTLFYKGEIYTGYLMAFGTDSVFMADNGENYLNIGLESYKKSLAVSNKFKEDIENSLNQKKELFFMGINILYDQGKFTETAEAYEMQVKLSDGMNKVDTLSMFNSGICYEKANDFNNAARMFSQCAKIGYKAPSIYKIASFSYRTAGKNDEAKAIIAEGRKKFPTDRELLLELVNINIKAGDAAGAEAALSEAIEADSNNILLHYNIGTIYIDLKQYEKAEASLSKALEIDPNYDEAQYQLGAHLYNWGFELQSKAGQLASNDKNYDKFMNESNAVFKRAIGPLEMFAQKHPSDKSVLTVLSQLYRMLGNYEKSNEYKKRLDAIK